MDEVVDMARGVPQSFYVDEFAARRDHVRGRRRAARLRRDGAAADRRARTRAAMADYRRLAQFGLMVSDSSRGRVRSLAGRPLIRYDLCARGPVARFRVGLARLRELFEAAGAREVYLPLPAGVDARARARRAI